MHEASSHMPENAKRLTADNTNRPSTVNILRDLVVRDEMYSAPGHVFSYLVHAIARRGPFS